MNDERQKCIEALSGFADRLERAVQREGEIQMDWQACGVLWSYLSPALDMLKADNGENVSPSQRTEERQVEEGVQLTKSA